MSESRSFSCIPGSTAAELLRSEPAAVLFDVRDSTAYRGGHIDGAAQLSEDRLLAWMKRIPKDAPVLIYCYQGNASKTYAQMFADFRYTRVFSIDGGYPALHTALAATP
ncbi:MAG: thiosulfate sulfurtransferase [Proteobacteria bacterium]|nr:thiosulfate sulfurtransferase [Pseudomonadota bacterium]